MVTLSEAGAGGWRALSGVQLEFLMRVPAIVRVYSLLLYCGQFSLARLAMRAIQRFAPGPLQIHTVEKLTAVQREIYARIRVPPSVRIYLYVVPRSLPQLPEADLNAPLAHVHSKRHACGEDLVASPAFAGQTLHETRSRDGEQRGSWRDERLWELVFVGCAAGGEYNTFHVGS